MTISATVTSRAEVSVPVVKVRGPTGPTNVLTIGEVYTGAPGSSAEATISGEAPNQILTLVIPRGEKGLTGDTGAGAELRVNEGVIEWRPDDDPEGEWIVLADLDGLLAAAEAARDAAQGWAGTASSSAGTASAAASLAGDKADIATAKAGEAAVSATVATNQADRAQGYADGLSLPPIDASDAGRALIVNGAGDGYALATSSPGGWQQYGSDHVVSSPVASVDITDIPQTASTLRIDLGGVSHANGSNSSIFVQVSDDNGATWIGDIIFANNVAGSVSVRGLIMIEDYTSSGMKGATGAAVTSTANIVSSNAPLAAIISNVGAINAVRIRSAAGNLDAGTIRVFTK